MRLPPHPRVGHPAEARKAQARTSGETKSVAASARGLWASRSRTENLQSLELARPNLRHGAPDCLDCPDPRLSPTVPTVQPDELSAPRAVPVQQPGGICKDQSKRKGASAMELSATPEAPVGAIEGNQPTFIPEQVRDEAEPVLSLWCSTRPMHGSFQRSLLKRFCRFRGSAKSNNVGGCYLTLGPHCRLRISPRCNPKNGEQATSPRRSQEGAPCCCFRLPL